MTVRINKDARIGMEMRCHRSHRQLEISPLNLNSVIEDNSKDKISSIFIACCDDKEKGRPVVLKL